MSWFLWKCEHSWPSLPVKSKFSSSETGPIGFPTGESGAPTVLSAGKAGGRSTVGLELGYEVGKEGLSLGSQGPLIQGPLSVQVAPKHFHLQTLFYYVLHWRPHILKACHSYTKCPDEQKLIFQLTFHLSLHSLNKYVLRSHRMPDIELCPGRWGWTACSLPTRSLHSDSKICRQMGPTKGYAVCALY